MIPLRDLNPTRSTPYVTYAIIAANTLVFLFQLTLDPYSSRVFTLHNALIPALLQAHPLTPLTSMFMHGGFMHLLLNMWCLFIFGDNVEDALGRGRYLLFYLVSGLGAAAGQYLIDPGSTLPMIGASGAIAGVLAAYLRLYPHARILTLFPLLIFFFTQEIPAVLFIVFWFAMQVLSGVGSLSLVGSQQGGVAFFAHIGGFVVGFLLIRGLLPARNPTRGFRRPEQSPY